MPVCRTVGMDFLKTAPNVIVHVVDIAATPEQIFTVFEDENSWPQWFSGIKGVDWTTPKPYGVDTTRTVSLGALKVYEHFFHWEDNKRFAFYFAKTNLPFVKALVEDYLLEPIDDTMTRFTYTVAYEPAMPLSLLGPLGKAALSRDFKKAAVSLSRYMSKITAVPQFHNIDNCLFLSGSSSIGGENKSYKFLRSKR
ncbi:hypothetical protein A9Q81_21055, partial [Gammaproteobacteria bacterium 42_54_T18]